MKPSLRETVLRWLTEAVATPVTRRFRSDRLKEAVVLASRLRETIDEVESAALHFAALPTRRDFQRLSQRTQSIRRKLDALERSIAALEGEKNKL